MRTATAIRNRATHPKSTADLTIDDADIGDVRQAMFWTLSLTERVMAATNAALVTHGQKFRLILEALKQGDAEALAAYRYALMHDDADP